MVVVTGDSPRGDREESTLVSAVHSDLAFVHLAASD